MRVFVAGATGVLGRRVVDRLSNRTDVVIGLSRDEDGDEIVDSSGGTPHRGDVLERDTLVDGIDGCDVVVNLATAIPTETKPTSEDWERNDRIRRAGTRNLLHAATEVGVDHVVQQSIAWVARRPDGSPFSEESPLNPDRTTESAADAERLVLNDCNEHGVDATILRAGWVYASDSAQTIEIAENLYSGRMPIVGGGILGRKDATVSPIHADDAAAAYVDAIETNTVGIWNVVDDQPVTVADYLRTFADELDADSPRRVPGWLARLFVGKDTVRFLTSSMPTSNDPFCEASGWEPEYPNVRDGLRDVVETWEHDGYPFDIE